MKNIQDLIGQNIDDYSRRKYLGLPAQRYNEQLIQKMQNIRGEPPAPVT